MRVALLTLACAVVVHGHGRLADPPNRASLWRAGYNVPANYDDDGLNCGGFGHQWNVNGGKCGICGDAYDLPTPRPHELGGIYGEGIIVADYNAGDIVPFNIYISASHLGYWELRICTDPTRNDQECFDEYLVELEDGSTKYYPLRGSTTYIVNYRIPPTLSCEHCVLQWKYTAGNNWGVCKDGTGALGCGNQETFYSCADISVTGPGDSASYIPVVNAVENANEVVLNEDIPSRLLHILANGFVNTKGLLHLLLKDKNTGVHHRVKEHRKKHHNKHKIKHIKDKKHKRHKRKKVSHHNHYKKIYNKHV